ncbi:hypothetical protein Lal_00026776 [Lupinus albus]|nr:hypothetical protein Lal_00026776 [Lupinus albus]
MGITLPKTVIDGPLKIILRGAIKVLGAGFGNSRPPKIFSSSSGSRPNYHHYMAIVLRIQDLIHMDWEISINHILREGKFCADYLAKKGATSTSTFTILDYVPYELKHMLFFDAIGTWYARS